MEAAVHQQASAANQSVTVPWWSKYTRWRQTSHQEAVAAEQHLLSLALSPNDVSVKDVQVGQHSQECMHTITAGLQQTSSPNLVCIPGYGAGVGFYFRIISGLGVAFKTFAVDLLGTGLSGRPPYRARDTQQSEDFFVNSLEKWREKEGIEKMILMGHSLGGYLSTVYALRHPERVKHLVLVCPAGVGRKPDDWVEPEVVRNPLTLRGSLYRLARNVWNWGITPGSIIRILGPWGPGLVSKYSRNRFKQGLHLTEDEVSRFEKYFYHITAARGSGEYALRHLLEPFAWPKNALEGRMQHLKVPVTFIYGDHDWMDPKAAARVVESLSGQREALVASDLKILTTPNAGHYPFMDQPGIFLKQIAEACDAYLPAAAKESLRFAANKQPYRSIPRANSDEQIAKELQENPMEAEAHMAAEM